MKTTILRFLYAVLELSGIILEFLIQGITLLTIFHTADKTLEQINNQ